MVDTKILLSEQVVKVDDILRWKKKLLKVKNELEEQMMFATQLDMQHHAHHATPHLDKTMTTEPKASNGRII